VARRPAEATSIVAATRAELESLRQSLAAPELFGARLVPEDFYRAGVNRRTGLWPAVADRERFRTLVAALPSAPKQAPAATEAPRAARARRAAAAMAPVATFRGFLAFEDQAGAAQRQALADALGLAPGWGTESWAWALAARLTGKATLADVVDQLEALGLKIDMAKAVALVNELVRLGKARLRPMLGPADLRRALRAAGVRRGSVLAMHASLSQFGYIPGGAATLVDAVLDVLGPRGTLCMPAHSLSLLGNTPYEPSRSPSVVGSVSAYLLKRPGAIRSLRPTHSVVALGPAARELTALPRPDLAPLSREGFWGKLYDADGDVLLLCPVTSATIFHVGENWTGVPQPPLVVHARDGNGRRRVFTIPQAPWHVDHFERTMAAPLLRSGAMRRVPLGEGAIYRASARAMADISVAVHRANPLASLGRNGGCHCFYCSALRRGMEMR
jgi:aminoglycoside 3-N-acetyltransferase